MRGRPRRRFGRGPRPGLPPRAAPRLVEGAGRPGGGVEGVRGELGAGQPLGDRVGDPARAVGGDDLDAGAQPLREQAEEGVELALVVPDAGPHDPSAVVVDHHGHVLAALLAAGLVDADRARPVEAAPARRPPRARPPRGRISRPRDRLRLDAALGVLLAARGAPLPLDVGFHRPLIPH